MTNKKREWEVVYQGKGISLNDFYSQKHYRVRHKIKKEYTSIFNELIEEAGVEYIESYVLTCYFNSRHDTSNVSGMIKMFEDTLVGVYVRSTGTYEFPRRVPDDSKKYCKGIEIYPDESLPKNCFKFILKEQ